MSEGNRRSGSWVLLMLGALALPLAACSGPVPEEWNDGAAGTGPTDREEAEEVIEAEQVWHMRFPADMPLAEAQELWEAAVADALVDKATKRDQFVFEITTWTGDGQGDGTDGDVHGKVWFRSNRLATLRVDVTMHENEKVYDPFRSGAREPGYYDTYRFVATKKVKWVSIKKAEVSLKGTDGWFLEDIHVRVRPEYQFWPASGWSSLSEEPRFWLDNSSSGDWQSYTTPTYSKWGAQWMEFN